MNKSCIIDSAISKLSYISLLGSPRLYVYVQVCTNISIGISFGGIDMDVFPNM